jgi:hypothetical protein
MSLPIRSPPRRSTIAACLFWLASAMPFASDAQEVPDYLPVHNFSGGTPGAQFGRVIARDGEWLAIGAPDYDIGSGDGSGAVSVFRWAGGQWNSVGELSLAVLADLTPQSDARFGAALAVQDNWLLIGCPGCESPRPKAYLVELADPFPAQSVWYPLHPALISVADPELGIGAAVAMSDTTVAIGAPLARSSVAGAERGAVAIGRFNGKAVEWEEILFGPASPADTWFGYSLAMAFARTPGASFGLRSLLIGAPAHVNNGSISIAGRAWLYQRDSFASGEWALRTVFTNPTPGLADLMGYSVAIEHPTPEETAIVVLGAPGRGVGGRAFVHMRDPAEEMFALDDEIESGEAEGGDRFGIAVAVHRGRVLVGADRRHVDADADQGAAYLLERRLVPGDTEWQVQQRIEFVGSNNVNFGRSLEMSGGTIVVGAPAISGGLATAYVCDRIFTDGVETGSGQACALP